MFIAVNITPFGDNLSIDYWHSKVGYNNGHSYYCYSSGDVGLQFRTASH